MEKDLELNETEILPPLVFEPCKRDKLQDVCEVACLKCENMYEFPHGKDDYLGHLFLEHRLIIADVDDIADLVEYLIYWKDAFRSDEIEQFCSTMLLDQLPDGTSAKNEKYYLLSDVLPRDYELRHTLEQKRLERALAQHQFERMDRDFTKQCLYCRDVITGLRSDYLGHLFKKHFLQLGKPENLVFIEELIARVQRSLEQLICLYCEKVFKDRSALKEHMRKKAHKRINPNNRSYDKYFLINYRGDKLKAGKSIKNRTERPRRKRPLNRNPNARSSFIQSSSDASILKDSVVEETLDRHLSGSDSSDSEWSEWDGEQQTMTCLYCPHRESDFSSLKNHMRDGHQVDFEAAIKAFNFYDRVKIVNYIRRQVCFLRCVMCNVRFESSSALLEHMGEKRHFGIGSQSQWNKPEYFFSTYEDDGVLCMLDDSANDDASDDIAHIISEDPIAQINKDAEELSLENFPFL